MSKLKLLAATILLAASTASAQQASVVSDEPTATDVATAPLPGNEDGRVDEEPDESTGRVIARGVLFLPKTAISLAFKPFEGAAYAYEKYQLGHRIKEIFWNDAGTMGLFPILTAQSGYGLDIGLKFVHLDLFGGGEQLSAQTSGGGEYEMNNKVRLRSGQRFENVELQLDARYQKKPNDTLYGVGNDGMTEGHYRDRVARVTAAADFKVSDPVHITTSAAYADHDYSQSGDASPVTNPDMLPGFGGTKYGYGELELRYDSRRAGDAREAPSVPSTGTLLAAYGGIALAADDTSANYGQYGFDAQQFIRLAEGPRVLAFRAHADAVTGPIDDVPFTELPTIGGKQSMRGYTTDRYRDRIAAVASAEYSWDLARALSAQLFVDAGRVYSDYDELSVNNMRVGYGVGLDLHGDKSFLGRVSVASSIDGGMFVDFSFDPVFNTARRIDSK